MPSESSRTKNSSLHPATARKISKILIRWGKKHYQPFPWRSTTNSWHGLIAEILLQRTRAWNVVPVYYDFIEKYSTPNLLSEASIKEIEDVIYPLGLHWRATFLKNLGRQLEIKGGSIPTNFEELITLSGVGPYVASAWLCFHAGIRAVIIDANIVRFLCRFLGRPRDAETRRKKWINEIASLLTPPRAWKFYNYAILDFTMQICSKEPACTICPLTSLGCRYFEEISQKGN